MHARTLSRSPFRTLAFASALALAPALHAQRTPAPHTFTVSGSTFQLDGKPFQIISGSMHYPRVPRAYWRDRFRKARAMGLNTITTYVFWNVHEPRPGVFDFSGQNDLAEYLREAQQEGLFVLLRPGPYVCAEWELGGYPSWLLKDPSLVLRSRDPKYTAAVHTWFQRLGQEVRPFLLKNGGPILAVQLENEYGSFGDDKDYLEGLKQELISSGMGDALLYTADGPAQVPKGSLPELPAVINFGTGDAHDAFAKLAQLRPSGPRMSGEYWDGWFDHWGEHHHETDATRQADELRWMLQQGYSVSMYMFHGGTSFGWMNGANSNGTNYEPDTTSYDYDAPVAEDGEPRAKFNLFRDIIAHATGITPPALPAPIPRSKFPVTGNVQTASLWNNLPAPVQSSKPLAFEDLDQSFGYVLYRTPLAPNAGGKLVLNGLHDYAQVYVDHKLLGTLDRREDTDSLDIPAAPRARTLDILVENSGRVNFTKVIRGERKGLTGKVTLAGVEPSAWEIFPLPMTNLSTLKFTADTCTGPCFYRTALTVDHPADTYLDTHTLHKGFVWLGDRPLGRFWHIGPQGALYTPAPWLHSGNNPITWFDLKGQPAEHLTSTNEPIWGNFTTPE